MHPNATLIHRFYTAFANGDAVTMAQCYHPSITFTDPAFGELLGAEVAKMWRMLIARSKGGLSITHNNVHTDNETGSAEWVARYTFGTTGRKVCNQITARFTFRDGQIIRHEDHFDLWRWARQALGWNGWLLGWSGFFQKQLQRAPGSCYCARNEGGYILSLQ